jgi:hypothetical protein
MLAHYKYGTRAYVTFSVGISMNSDGKKFVAFLDVLVKLRDTFDF